MGICFRIYAMLFNILFLACLVSIVLDVGQCFRYNRDTERTLCRNQCACLCSDDKAHCSETCNNDTVYRFWMTNCDEPYANCFGTCQVLTSSNRKISNIFTSSDVDDESSRYPHIPTLHISAIHGDSIQLSWDVQNAVFKILYVIQMKRAEDPEWQVLQSEIDGNEYNVTVPDICLFQFRIMAMNLFGSNGFSAPVSVRSVPLEPIRNITLLGGAIYYNQPTGEFMSIIQWQDISDLDEQVVSHYSWNDMSYVKCPRVSQNMQPSFSKLQAKHGRKFILMRVSRDAYGCIFTTQVKAKSVCGDVGGWTNYTMDLSDCNKIHNFPCSAVKLDFSPPGNVWNVTLHADKGQDPALIRLDWLPPNDKGSMGRLDHYIIRWGKVMEPDPMDLLNQGNFASTPNMTKLPSNICTFAVFVAYSELTSSRYGFQIIPVAPTQNMTDSEFDLFTIYQLQSTRTDHVIHGTILMDGDGVKIVQVPNTLDVEVVWRLQHGRRSLNESRDMVLNHFYAVKYGKLKYHNNGPDIFNGNVTLVDAEESFLIIEITEPGDYNLQIIGLENETFPEDEDWMDSKIYNFTVKELLPNTDHEDGYKIALQIIIPLFAVISIPVIFIFLKWFRAVYKLKKKIEMERRLGDLSTDFINDYTNFDRHPLTCHYHDRNDNILPAVVPDVWEIPHSCLKVGRVLGSGAFGQVLKGRVSRSILKHRNVKIPDDTAVNGTYISVAVKMLKDNADIEHKQDFLKEINLMKEIGFHTNIVSMFSCCTLQDPLCLIVEHLPHGDLQTYLTKVREVIEMRENQDSHYVNKDVDLLGPVDLLSFARQIAVGMEYLSQKGFVHRDLAARNILVGNNKVVKIGDFGLTRFVCNEEIYINRKGGKFPLKWMSIEAIEELRFSCASDVWSFGIVLFEIVTLGGTLYPTVDPRQLLEYLKNGQRMERPDNCSEELYRVMMSCWEKYPNDRPSFTTLKEKIESMLLESCGLEYFTLMIDKTKSYYNIVRDKENEIQNISIVSNENVNSSVSRCGPPNVTTIDNDSFSPVRNTAREQHDSDSICLTSKYEHFVQDKTIDLTDCTTFNHKLHNDFLNASMDNVDQTLTGDSNSDCSNGHGDACITIPESSENKLGYMGQNSNMLRENETVENHESCSNDEDIRHKTCVRYQSDKNGKTTDFDSPANEKGVEGHSITVIEKCLLGCETRDTDHCARTELCDAIDDGHNNHCWEVKDGCENKDHGIHKNGWDKTFETKFGNPCNIKNNSDYRLTGTLHSDSDINDSETVRSDNFIKDSCENHELDMPMKNLIKTDDNTQVVYESEVDSPIADRESSVRFRYNVQNPSFLGEDLDYEADNSSLSETSPSNGCKRISFSSSNEEDEVFKFPKYVQTKRYPQEKHPRFRNRLVHRGSHTHACTKLSNLTDSGISTSSYSELPV